MTDEQYQKLNEYMNNCFQGLEKCDSFYLRNISSIAYLSQSFKNEIGPFLLKNNAIQNHLSFQDIYALAREVIETIHPKYLEQFDTIIESGVLDFSYDHEYTDSHFIFLCQLEQCEINLNREFNYNDVVILIHEFFHLLNGTKKKFSKNQYLVTEFISIYFETFAVKYLIDVKHIPPTEICAYDRLLSTLHACNIVDNYSIPFAMYEWLGEVHPKNLPFISRYVSISEKEFSDMSEQLLQMFEQKNQEYCDKYRIVTNIENRNHYLAKEFRQYRYILGTLLAFYAQAHVNIQSMVSFNDHINEFQSIGISQLMQEQLKIDINEKTFSNECLLSILTFLDQYGEKRLHK